MHKKHHSKQSLKLLFCFSFIIVNFVAYAQQDPQYSQNMFNHMTVNPGFAGNSGAINASLLNRIQWVSFPGAPVTTAFNVDATVGLIGREDGIGLTIVNDEIGYQQQVSVGLNYAYRLDLGTGKLGIGLFAGMLSKTLNPEWTTVEGWENVESTDGLIPSQEVSGMVGDIGFGLFYSHRKYYLGLSATHLTQPSFEYEESGKYSMVRHFYFTGGYNIQLSDPLFEVQPSIFFKTDAASYQVDFNVNLLYNKRYWGGLSYRINDAIVILLGTELRNGIRLGYAYDLTTSALARYSSGSHELVIGYSLNLNKRRVQKYKSVRFL